ncbi:MAG: response regulator transcription factor [Acidimicrobiales bacterium]|nr:response regulator transcription factor [Acidimicrobiales bacterium]
MAFKNKAARRVGSSVRSTGPIMVVSDDKPGTLVGQLLNSAGHDVVLVADLDSAIATVNGARPALSCIVADRDARIADSVVQLTQRVRALGPEVLAEVPIVILGTASSKQFLLWQSGIDAYLQRPILAEHLIERVEAAIHRHDFDRKEIRQAKIAALSNVETV